MIFWHFRLDVEEANSYIVACPETREALLVDVGEWTPAMEQFLEMQRLRLSQVFITHDHYDHRDGLADVVKRFAPEVHAGKAEILGIAAAKVGHGDTIGIGALCANVLATPGHTPEGLSLAFPGHVFTGDVLFAGSVGGTGSAELFQQQLDHIRRHIFSLPGSTEIHPGHGPASTVEIERQYNPFFL